MNDQSLGPELETAVADAKPVVASPECEAPWVH